ncbi:MAG: putative metal-dependent enzyme (double-stranded beta helix superfamily) [Parasphingorhabdus sp.]|jgi:predicted metal-dependent enzyme (double-stranded beta helix superfamily)
MTFELEQFIDNCRSALKETDAHEAIAELAREAVSSPTDIIKTLGEPTLGGLNTLYHAPDLTILNIVWAPTMTLYPHNHCMWAAIGIYDGREENTFYRRDHDSLTQHGIKMMERGDVAKLGEDIIHSVHNPDLKLTSALHIYGGDFFEAPRSEWDMETFSEAPYNIENTRAAFEESNKILLKET